MPPALVKVLPTSSCRGLFHHSLCQKSKTQYFIFFWNDGRHDQYFLRPSFQSAELTDGCRSFDKSCCKPELGLEGSSSKALIIWAQELGIKCWSQKLGPNGFGLKSLVQRHRLKASGTGSKTWNLRFGLKPKGLILYSRLQEIARLNS